jgi:hypothetical protein
MIEIRVNDNVTIDITDSTATVNVHNFSHTDTETASLNRRLSVKRRVYYSESDCSNEVEPAGLKINTFFHHDIEVAPEG